MTRTYRIHFSAAAVLCLAAALQAPGAAAQSRTLQQATAQTPEQQYLAGAQSAIQNRIKTRQAKPPAEVIAGNARPMELLVSFSRRMSLADIKKYADNLDGKVTAAHRSLGEEVIAVGMPPDWQNEATHKEQIASFQAYLPKRREQLASEVPRQDTPSLAFVRARAEWNQRMLDRAAAEFGRGELMFDGVQMMIPPGRLGDALKTVGDGVLSVEDDSGRRKAFAISLDLYGGGK